MPKYPEFSRRISQIPGAVFEKYRKKMRAYSGKMVYLHIGDTWMSPDYELPLSDGFKEKYSDFNRYCNTFGYPDLVAVLRDKITEDTKLSTNTDNILVTSGATQALSTAVLALMDPGEEILVLTPFWPIFNGIVRSAEVRSVEAPLYMLLYENPDLDITSYLDGYISEKTVAVYLNSPNNPSGKVLHKKHLEQVAAVAKKYNLWVLSDEAYEGLTYDENCHISVAAYKDLFDRTVSVFTFSKIFMFAGVRLGYAVALPRVITALNKILVHQVYGAPTVTQQMMVEPVKQRHSWMKEVCRKYQDMRDLVVANAKFDFQVPEATYFIFFSIESYLRGRSVTELIKDCFDNGVSVAPGGDFGAGFEKYIRLCFTGVEPQELVRGIKILNRVLLS